MLNLIVQKCKYSVTLRCWTLYCQPWELLCLKENGAQLQPGDFVWATDGKKAGKSGGRWVTFTLESSDSVLAKTLNAQRKMK